MKWHEYYWKWLRIAFQHSLGKPDLVAGVLAVALPAIAWALGKTEVAAMNLAWQIPVGLCVALVASRLLLAPYWMYLEFKAERGSLINKLTGELDSVKSIVSTLILENKAKQGRLMSELSLFIATGNELAERSVTTEVELMMWKTDLTTFRHRSENWVKTNFGQAEMVVRMSGSHKIENADGSFNEEHNRLRCGIIHLFNPGLRSIYENLRSDS